MKKLMMFFIYLILISACFFIFYIIPAYLGFAYPEIFIDKPLIFVGGILCGMFLPDFLKWIDIKTLVTN